MDFGKASIEAHDIGFLIFITILLSNELRLNGPHFNERENEEACAGTGFSVIIAIRINNLGVT